MRTVYKVIKLVWLLFLLLVACSAAPAKYQPVPLDLKSFLSELHKNAKEKNIHALAQAVHPLLGVRIGLNIIDRWDIEYVLDSQEKKTYDFAGEGMTWTEQLTLAELLFSEYRIFSHCAEYDMANSFMAPLDERWIPELQKYFADGGYECVVFPWEEGVYELCFSGAQDFELDLVKIGDRWYVVRFGFYE